MATFESGGRVNRPSTSTQKYPYKRLESSVHKLFKVLQVDLDRLERHRVNIEKHQISKQWKLLSKEQINSSRTVKQLKATMKQLEQIRGQIELDDLPKFDNILGDIQQRTIASIVEFLDLQKHGQGEPLSELTVPQVGPGVSRGHSQTDDEPALVTTDGPADSANGEEEFNEDEAQRLSQVQLESEIVANQLAEQSWQELKMGLVELNSLVHEYSTLVHSQQGTVDRIEDNVESAQANVEEGTFNLGTAAKLKGAIFPVAGAVLGGVLGGPVGLVAGLKLGGLAAVTGGIAGFSSGHLLKKRQDNIVEREMEQLEQRKAQAKLSHIEDPSCQP